MELISHHIHANATFSSNQKNNQNQIISLENLASKQRIFRIVKEQHGFMLTVRSKDCSVAGFQCADFRNNLNIAPVRSWQVIAAWRLVEPAGIEPATSWLQTRRSPS